jgi:hypothetical protein
MHVSDMNLQAFYTAGALTLRALDSRAAHARVFGPDADAEWGLFKGELHDGDRLDLLVRDAAVAHPAAFAPRVVFALDGLSDDESFGPEWPGVDGPHAAAALRLAAATSESTPDAWLRLIAKTWSLAPVEPASALKDIGPSTRILAAGAGAALALARHFAGRSDLDLGDQVAFFGSSPAERQLIGAAVALLDRPAAARVFDASSAADTSASFSADRLRARGFKRADRVLVSSDAPVGIEAKLNTLKAELG